MGSKTWMQAILNWLVDSVIKPVVIIAGAGGTPVQLDDTDKLAVSLYGKATAVGDTPLLVNSAGQLRVIAGDSLSPNDAETNASTGFATIAGTITRAVVVFNDLFNAAAGTWERQRNNHEVTALASAARTASVDSSDLTNYNARGVIVTIDVTAVVDTPSMVLTIQGKSSLGSDYSDILASAAITGAGVTRMIVYPGVTPAANAAVSQPLPRLWRVSVVNADADPITYSVSANYIN